MAGFTPLSLFVTVMSQEKPFAHLCALNPDSPVVSTAFGSEISRSSG